MQALQRVLAQDDVDGSIRADDQQRCRVAALRQHGNQVDGGIVAPVEIFEDEDERHSERRDERRRLAQQAFLRRPAQLALQRLDLLPREHPGSWMSQLGACWRSSLRTSVPGPKLKRANASRTAK